MVVEGQVLVTALFVENTLILRIGDRPARAGSHPDAALVFYRRHIRGHNGDHGHLRAFKFAFLNAKHGQRQDIAVGFHVRERQQQLFGNRQPAGLAVVPGADEQDAGLIVAGQVVGKSAHRLTAFFQDIAPVSGFAFRAIRLDAIQQAYQFSVRQS